MDRRFNLAVSFTLFVLLLNVRILDSTLSKSDKDKKKPTAKIKANGNGGVDSQITYQEILQNHNRVNYLEEKKFPNAVLAYVTPWNSHGYDIAKFLAQKFTHISPVWFQFKKDDDNFKITGTHDLDQGWISDVRKNNSNIKIVPRFLFEGWDPTAFRNLFMNEPMQEKCSTTIVNFLRRNKFNGAVLEFWVTMQAMSRGHAAQDLMHFVSHLYEKLHKNDLELILVVSAPKSPHPVANDFLFGANHFAALAPHVDYFSVMTYDYQNPSPGGVGPVAPMPWLKACAEELALKNPMAASKILIGLNFYGYAYNAAEDGPTAVVGNTFLDFLKNHQPDIRWNKQAMEHYVEHEGTTIYYPSIYSLEARMNLARELKVGLAVWEIGQGLDNFYTLF